MDELLKIIMLCFLKWRNGGFYNNNEGLFCLNEKNYYILKNKNINNIKEIFNCYELKDLF